MLGWLPLQLQIRASNPSVKQQFETNFNNEYFDDYKGNNRTAREILSNINERGEHTTNALLKIKVIKRKRLKRVKRNKNERGGYIINALLIILNH